MKTAVAAIEPEIIEPNHDLATQNAGGIVKTIARQIEAVRAAELRSTYEKLRLGAMVKQAVTLLGLDSKGGRGKVGLGVKGWWDANFKGADGEPVIKYTTLMNWIAAAEKLPALLTAERGGGVVAQDKMLALLAKDPEAVIAKSERKVLESAEKVANGMTLRQMLLWGDDAEPRRPGRPAGVPVEYRKRTAEEAAVEAVWPTVQHLLNHRGEMFTAYKLLPDDKLAEFRDTLAEHVKAITAVLDQRK